MIFSFLSSGGLVGKLSLDLLKVLEEGICEEGIWDLEVSPSDVILGLDINLVNAFWTSSFSSSSSSSPDRIAGGDLLRFRISTDSLLSMASSMMDKGHGYQTWWRLGPVSRGSQVKVILKNRAGVPRFLSCSLRGHDSWL